MSEERIVVSRAEYESLLEANARLAQAVRNLEEQLRLARRQRFGSKNKQRKYDDGSEQLGMEFLFNEVEFYDVMYSPLYRQQQELRRMGVQLSRQTMSKWLTLACEKYLKPLYERLKKRLQAADICHADETPLQGTDCSRETLIAK